jgi:hypothetical protein
MMLLTIEQQSVLMHYVHSFLDEISGKEDGIRASKYMRPRVIAGRARVGQRRQVLYGLLCLLILMLFCFLFCASLCFRFFFSDGFS